MSPGKDHAWEGEPRMRQEHIKWWGPVKSCYARDRSQEGSLGDNHPKCPSQLISQEFKQKDNGNISFSDVLMKNPALVKAKCWGLEELRS